MGIWVLAKVIKIIGYIREESDWHWAFFHVYWPSLCPLLRSLFRSFAHFLIGLWGCWLYKFWLSTLCQVYHWWICFPFSGLSFHFVDGFLCCAKTLVWCSLICLFFLLFPLPRDISEKNVAVGNIWDFIAHVLGFLWFQVLTFKSLIHFEFIFVYGVRMWSSFHFSPCICPTSHHYLLNRLSITHCIFLSPLSNIDYKRVGLFLGSLSILLMYMSVFLPVPCCFDYYGLVV